MEAIIELKNISFQYYDESKRAVDDVSFAVQKGEWIAIIGHNGSGKSTLAKMMNGLLEAQSGEILIDGEPLTEETVWRIRNRVGMVFQNPDNQFVGATVEDDIAFGLENIGVERNEMIERITNALTFVKMSDFRQKEPARLSGGQKQRVAIAGIVAMRPDIIILDEATSMLDPQGRREVIDTIRKLNQEQDVTVLSITHDLEEATHADRIFLMNQGRLQMVGTPADVFQLGANLVEAGLDVPFSEKLKQELRQRGIETPEKYMDEKGMIDWLWTSLLNK